MALLLVMLGFEYEVAYFGLQATRFHSIERAVSYLTDVEENGKYEHPFVGIN
jgi:hypothetical protein